MSRPPSLPPVIALAARNLCSQDGRNPDDPCMEVPARKGKRPSNLAVAAGHIMHHAKCMDALMAAFKEMQDACDARDAGTKEPAESPPPAQSQQTED